MLTEQDIMFNIERDGIPGVPVAMVIDGDVVWANVFKPSFAEEYIFSSPTFSSSVVYENEQEVEEIKITTASSETTIRVNEMLTAVLLSNPTIIRLDVVKDSHVMAGWRHDEKGFFLTISQNGQNIRLNGDGTHGEPN